MLLDYCLMSLLLVVAHLLRYNVPLLGRIHLPTPIIAGALALVGGDQLLAIVPFSQQADGKPALAAYPGVLVALLFATLFLGARKRDTGARAGLPQVGDTFFYNLASETGQYAAALLFGLLLLAPLFPGLDPAFALMLPAGFAGGHGTVTAIGQVLQQGGWPEALTVGYTLATVGLLSGIVGGMVLVNLATKRGWTRLIPPDYELPISMKTGFVPPGERNSTGEETVSPTALDTLAWHVAQVAVDPQLIVDRLVVEQDISARRGLILALGEYPPELLSPRDRGMAVAKSELFAAFRNVPDAGFHSAVEWLLRQWGFTDELKAIRSEVTSRKPSGAGDWYVTAEGQTMAILEGKPFTMGSPEDEIGRSVAERRVRKQLERTFAISTKEVTVAQFERYLAENPGVPKPGRTVRHSPDPNGPMTSVAWYHAAGYCRWLSEKEGTLEDQMCYPPVPKVKNRMQMPADYLARSGYRLPTEAEWEFACRAGSTTSRFFGQSEEMLDHYAWYVGNSQDRAWPCGSLKPNDRGLFDMHGNVWEWCQDRWTNRWFGSVDGTRSIDADTNRVLRGGSFDSSSRMVRSAYYDRFEKPTVRSDEIGFRIARTYPE